MSSINEPITVRITPYNIEITSFPGFDRSISDKNIADYSIRARIYRNRRIGDFLKELRLIEGRNTGFPNAIKALKENGSDLFTFEMDDNRTYLSVTIPVHKYFITENDKENKITAYENKITATLKETPLSMTELAHAMGYKGITAKLKKIVSEMILKGTLEKIVDNDNKVKLKTK